MFSKIDETLDDVFIPYFNSSENRTANFKPDFIFWMQKANNYIILFVDPKGTEYTSGYRKIDGYKRLFAKDKSARIFNHDTLNVRVKLLLKTNDIASVPELYRNYWFDNLQDLTNKINE